VAALALALAPARPASSAGERGATAILAVGFDRGGSAAAIDRSQTRARSAAGDLEILRVGEPGELSGDWEVAVYVDQWITGTRSILRFLESLASQTGGLTALGEVQLVLAGDERSTAVRTSDATLLEEFLFQQSLRAAGTNRLREHRLELLQALDSAPDDRTELIRAALDRERELLRSRRDELIDWVVDQGHGESPRALFFLAEGLGADPLAFYEALLEDGGEALPDAGSMAELGELAEVLASYGWVFVPTVVPPAPAEDDEALSLRTNRSIGFRLRLGSQDREEGAEEPAPDLRLEQGRGDALTELARLTGGRFASTLEELPVALSDLASRRPVEIALPAGQGEPLAFELEVRDPAVEVRSPQWVGGRPELVAEVRIRRSLGGDGDPGDLPLRARIHLDAEDEPAADVPAEGQAESTVGPAELDLAVDLSPVDPAGPTVLRVSLGIHRQDGGLDVRHEIVETDPADGATFTLRRPLDLPASTDAAVVVVEALERGLWGENFAEFVTAPAPLAPGPSAAAVTPSRPAGPALLLEPLPPDTRSGKVRVRTRARGDVDEVVFLVDGERVGRRRSAPFDLRVDLGDAPEQRSIIAIAYDAGGRELGRDGLVVNEAATNFWVQIVEPRAGERVGPVDVVTGSRLPEGGALERIDYYWNDELVASTREEPHRHRLLIPVDQPAGYIRVVATLADGRTAEDVVLMNTRRFESEILVELVELYVVVTDRTGKPVRGLDRADFVVREEQEVQEVESFAVAGDLPLTLGLAIDSSLSLFKKLPEVQTAATRFVESLKPDRDRAFLVGYSSQPRLVQPTTGDLDRIIDGIGSLAASGNTAVWEAVTLSLEELQPISGRKALVVFYDGDDEDETYSFKRTLDEARQSLIPIYLIVMNDEAARTQGKGFSVRSRIARLDQLARTGGGRVFYVRTDEDLSPIFADISAELRSHYLLTYYPQRPVQEPEWRPISVELTRADLTARTISGYGGG
jgi:Ca-activated chloride channel family protein